MGHLVVLVVRRLRVAPSAAHLRLDGDVLVHDVVLLPVEVGVADALVVGLGLLEGVDGRHGANGVGGGGREDCNDEADEESEENRLVHLF